MEHSSAPPKEPKYRTAPMEINEFLNTYVGLEVSSNLYFVCLVSKDNFVPQPLKF